MKLAGIALAAAVALAVPSLAWAQATASKPVDVAAAQAEIERLIAATGRPDAFAGWVTKSGLRVIQHRESGMRCSVGDPGERLELIQPTAEHDGGVRCVMVSSGGDYPTVIEVVRAKGRVDLAALAETDLAADRARWPDLKIVRTGPKGRPKFPIADRVMQFDGAPPTRYAYVALGLKGAWIIHVRLEDSSIREGFKPDTAEFIGMLHMISATDLVAG